MMQEDQVRQDSSKKARTNIKRQKEDDDIMNLPDQEVLDKNVE